MRHHDGQHGAPKPPPRHYQAYTLHNFRKLPQLERLSPQQIFDMEVVGHVLPFKTNNYVVEELIDWNAVPHDPMFILTFPQRDMLLPEHYEEMSSLLRNNADGETIKNAAHRMRMRLNPHPAGQLEHNVPILDGEKLHGMQHKYRETVLFFPSQGQTCHAYCTFCFRWPQFVGEQALRFAARETEQLVGYLRRHEKVTDVLFTGGDPLTMSTKALAAHIEPLLAADLPNLKRIRIGTKAFSYWPHRFLDAPDGEALLKLFRKVVHKKKHLAIMAHFNHPRELQTRVVQQAIRRVRSTGAIIRTQSPVLRHINDNPAIWTELWNLQVDLGCVPYYMFVARNTGARHYFALPLVRAWEVFREAYQRVSGLARTVRGPSMSSNPGKIQVLGVNEAGGERVFVLRFLQGRNPDWVQRPFFAAYSNTATWLNELRPAFGAKRFFFEGELEEFFRENLETPTDEDFE